MTMRYTEDAQIFTDKAECGAEFEKRSAALHAKLGDGWTSKRFDTVEEAIEFFKDTHPFIAESLRAQEHPDRAAQRKHWESMAEL
jgi:hypothetical protein